MQQDAGSRCALHETGALRVCALHIQLSCDSRNRIVQLGRTVRLLGAQKLCLQQDSLQVSKRLVALISLWAT